MSSYVLCAFTVVQKLSAPPRASRNSETKSPSTASSSGSVADDDDDEDEDEEDDL